MCRILFWNVQRKDLTELICALVQSSGTDVLVLNECRVGKNQTLEALRSGVDDRFFAPDSNSEHLFHCFCRDSRFDLTEVHAGNRTSVRKLKIGGRPALLGFVHGLDVRNYDSETRQGFVQMIAEDISLVKETQGTNRLVLIGDFNMNPYDRSMNLAMGLNAMMTRICASEGQRVFQGKKYDLYYNPMWSLFGDNSKGPPGTVYDTSNQGPYGWSMFDQVLINHSLVKEFQSVQILTQAGAISLTDSKGRPNKATASDHLPILVDFKDIDHE